MKRYLIFLFPMLAFVASSCGFMDDEGPSPDVEFHGITFVPIGDSKLEVENGKLHVSRLDPNSEYGARFRVDASDLLHFAVEGIPMGLDESFDVKILGDVNGTEQEVQHFAYLGTGDDSSSYFRLSFPEYLVDSLSISGQYLDSTVFDYTVALSDLPGKTQFWWIPVIGIVTYVGDNICYRSAYTDYDQHGHKKYHSSRWNWNDPVKATVPRDSGSTLTATIDYLSIVPVYHSSVSNIRFTEVQTRAIGGNSYKFKHVEAY